MSSPSELQREKTHLLVKTSQKFAPFQAALQNTLWAHTAYQAGKERCSAIARGDTWPSSAPQLPCGRKQPP